MPKLQSKGAASFWLSLALSTTALGSTLAPTVTAALPSAAPTPAAANPPVFFAQEQSDITPDPGARFGKLPNGMTYVIYKNATPPGTANVYMRIGAGSLMEAPYQQGLAHFLEHMAFGGSKNVPKGEMIRLLQRDGLSFGADTNAFTADDQTVYMLNLPTVEPRVVDDTLFLMREVAGNLNLDPTAIDLQRGVILGEERLRASAGERAFEDWTKTAYPGELYPQRQPIGQIDVIKTAPPQALRDFYNDYYRPEYATLIVVGDIDPDQIESKIKARFSDWVGGPRTDHALTNFGTYRPKGLTLHAYAEKGLPDSLTATWAGPADDRVETQQKDFEDLLDSFGEGILGARIERQLSDPSTAYVNASFGKENVEHTATIYSLSVDPKPGQAKLAFEQALMTVRQFKTFGVTQAELDRALINYANNLENSARSERTRSSGQITNAILTNIGAKGVLTNPTQELAFFNKVRSRITLEAINTRIKTTPFTDGPILSRTGEDVSVFGPKAMAASLADVMNRPVSPPPPHVVPPWTYTTFGTPSKVVARKELTDLGITQVTFANGVTLSVKPTHFSANDVSIAVRFDGGELTIPAKDTLAVRAASAFNLVGGGLGRIKGEDISDALTGKVFGLNYYMFEDAAYLRGDTIPRDLGLQMQLLAAFTTDSAVRPTELERMKVELPEKYIHLYSSPAGVLNIHKEDILHGGDAHYKFPSQQELDSVRDEDVKALLTGIFSKSPIEVTIVGDITVDEAIKQVGLTFGALPPRPAHVTPLPWASEIKFPSSNLHQVFTHNGRPDQNVSFLAWPTTDFYSDPQRARALDVLAEVMSNRLLDEIREKQGATYSIFAVNNSSTVFKGYGVLSTSGQVRPEGDEQFYQSVAKIAEGLKAKPVTDDELLRARQPMLDHLANDANDNDFWLHNMLGSTTDMRRLDELKLRRQEIMAVTTKQLQDLAVAYLDMPKAVRLQVKATDAP